MQTITTRYKPATNHSGARIVARATDGARVVHPWSYALDDGLNHFKAAAACADRNGWSGSFAQGQLPDGTRVWLLTEPQSL